MKFQIIILAAGKGKRLGADLPKSLVPVGGKSILQRQVEVIKASGITSKPVVVIGPEGDRLCEHFNEECLYAMQEKQLGTGHAVMISKEAVGDVDAVIVLYGDHPFISSDTLKRLAEKHEQSESVMTMMTTIVPSFDDWYGSFVHWGRILRDGHGHLLGIRQYKDAMESERAIKEVDPALYAFNADWLWQHISEVKNFNAQEEYYLTDMLELAVTQGHDIPSIEIPPEEALAINTPEELAHAEMVCKKFHA
jgi:bifunctional UDP-N-acetylglucosamine pyrophosphorylase / glucosamine-1-phosphate N-acetyltransferase